MSAPELEAPAAAPPPRDWPPAAALAAVSDARLVALIGLGLFVLSAWPLLLVPSAPFQDLPNHLATAHIVAHPELYPEFTFNGLFKANSLLTLWLYLVGSHGLYGAGRLFTAFVLAANAFALPLFVLRFAGRRAVPVAALFLWPLVHGFTVSMGFLNFSFAFALSLVLLAVVDRQRERPTGARGAGIAVLAVVVWYAHPFPLAVMGVLVAADVARRPSWPARIAAGRALLLPLLPAGALALMAAQHHLVKAEHSTAAAATFSYLNPWENLEHLWLDASGAFTRWGTATVVPAILLPIFAWRSRRLERPFFSSAAVLGLLATYVALPEMLSNWNYLNCRLVPFIWVGLGLRLPNRLPRPTAVALALSAVAFSAVLGVDYLRLDRERAAFTAGIDAVPRRATLLPLLFEHRRTSVYTASLTHAWGYYTIERDTSAPLVFGVERTYPITYREFPPRALIPPALDRFAELNGTPARICNTLKQPPDAPACGLAWRALWATFWEEAEPRFSHLLTWAMPPEARTLIPAHYRRVFAAGPLEIYAREGSGN